ncbi:MAG TPA: integrase, partial [Sphingobium sp.]|uniref:integrase n=1 Tax=Sphingobium sp. TaxID=1912891 RepID=UPI002ED3CF49
TPLRHAAELFLLSLRQDPPEGRMPLRKETIYGHFGNVRFLVRWMATENVRCFRELDQDTVDRFVAMLRARPGRNGALLSISTAEGHLGTIRTFHMQRDKLDDAPLAAPPRASSVGKRHWKPYGGHPYTPDQIAVPLVSGAIELLGEPADRILALRDRLEDLYDQLRSRHQGRRLHWHIRRAMLEEPCPCADRYPNPEWPLRRLAFMLDRLGDACFIVIAYLVGARASEILRLEEGCLERRVVDGGEEEHVYLVGTITKTSLTEDGDIHRWLAPEPVQRAITILERLSAPLRALSGKRNLWLHQLGYGRSPLPTAMPVGRLRSNMVNARLNERLAPFLALPDHQGGTWRLTTYQGRKTFSRFIGRRDRTGLTALQRHLGHVHRAMTDRAYVGTDFELAELIDDHAAEETRKALEDLLLAPHVAGKAGVMLSERSPFRGRTRSGDVDGYITEILAETDMRLGVCDWGYCVYRRETSACLGGEREPNPVLRTQSTCSTCANFAVTDRHRPVWEARLERNTALIQRDDLDGESRALAEARIQESRRILDQLDEGNAGDV